MTTAGKHDARPTILLAEDDEDNRSMMRALLEARGYGVIEAADGQQAVELTRGLRPDLVLMDLRMPVLNGLAATRAIRQQPDARLRRVPIIALSAYDPAQHRAVAVAAGCDDYVTKPVDQDLLARKIAALLGLEDAPPAHDGARPDALNA
jgi:two-component system, cell cycle response regulator DivK